MAVSAWDTTQSSVSMLWLSASWMTHPLVYDIGSPWVVAVAEKVFTIEPLHAIKGIPPARFRTAGRRDLAHDHAARGCRARGALRWVKLALQRRYPGELPQRGGVMVEFRESEREGSTGVAAAVVQMLMGAAGDLGFKGVQARFARVGLQRFGRDIPLSIRFTRLTTAPLWTLRPTLPCLGLGLCRRHGLARANRA